MPTLTQFYTGKTVVITGAASGIGRALAECFARSGAKLSLADIDADALKKVAETLQQHDPHLKVLLTPFDVSNKAAWQSFLARTAEQFGQIDVLINNAGIEGSSQPVWATSDETLERVMAVNFYGMVYGSKAILPYFAQRPWAALVNVSSIFGLIAPPNTADYAASKFAIRGYTESLHAELAQLFPQIQVHLVHPGGINTNITRLAQSQAFKAEFLTTPAHKLADMIAKSVMRKRARIVYGNRATLVNIASRFLPLAIISRLIGKEMEKLNMTAEYRKDHPQLNIKGSQE
jgi:short-subunit dehydrogenase